MRMERNSRKLIRLLEKDGWMLKSTKGSHHKFKHPTKKGRVIVAHPTKELKIGTVLEIYRQAGWRK